MKNCIEEYRRPLDLSQYRLGKKIGLSRVTVNKIETYKIIPNLSIAHAIAASLGVSIYEIFDLDGSGTFTCPCTLKKKRKRRRSRKTCENVNPAAEAAGQKADKKGKSV